jgi:hypothetical protein
MPRLLPNPGKICEQITENYTAAIHELTSILELNVSQLWADVEFTKF